MKHKIIIASCLAVIIVLSIVSVHEYRDYSYKTKLQAASTARLVTDQQSTIKQQNQNIRDLKLRITAICKQSFGFYGRIQTNQRPDAGQPICKPAEVQ